MSTGLARACSQCGGSSSAADGWQVRRLKGIAQILAQVFTADSLRRLLQLVLWT